MIYFVLLLLVFVSLAGGGFLDYCVQQGMFSISNLRDIAGIWQYRLVLILEGISYLFTLAFVVMFIAAINILSYLILSIAIKRSAELGSGYPIYFASVIGCFVVASLTYHLLACFADGLLRDKIPNGWWKTLDYPYYTMGLVFISFAVVEIRETGFDFNAFEVTAGVYVIAIKTLKTSFEIGLLTKDVTARVRGIFNPWERISKLVKKYNKTVTIGILSKPDFLDSFNFKLQYHLKPSAPPSESRPTPLKKEKPHRND
tara:strand:+ start:1741 stop:2514 length:774 start_codon:yes stop_codon:yes gene_type:complete